MEAREKIGFRSEVRGFFQNSSEARELIRGNRVKDGYYFIDFLAYRIDDLEKGIKQIDANPNKIIGKIKLYLTHSDFGISSNDSIFYYMSNDPNNLQKEWQTPISDVKKLYGIPAGIRGIIKKQDSIEYSYFMTKIEKIKLFVNPNNGKPLIVLSKK